MKHSGLADSARPFAEYTEVRSQENRSSQISLLNGDAVSNGSGTQSGVSARVHKNGVWGFASSPEKDRAALRSCVERATANALFLASKEGRDAGLLPSRPGTGDHDLASGSPGRSKSELVEFMRDLDAHCAKSLPGLASRSLGLSRLDMEKTLATSDGADSWSLIPRTLIFVSLTLAARGEPIELYDVFGGLGSFEDVFSEPSALYGRIDLLAERLRQKARGVYAKPGTHDVILDADLAGILAHEAIGHTVEADLVLGGSVAADYLGQPVASPLISLTDFAHDALGRRCPVPVWVDDEGIEARDAVIIDRGVLSSYMHNKESAAHFGAEPTGNARAYGFSDEPIIRMRNTAILPGQSSLEDMIAGVDRGYYFLRPSNGQADSTSEFMFGVTMGYEIRGGKLGPAVRDCTVSGVAFDVLKTVSAVSQDMSWTAAGMCGKKQSIPVGMGGPAIRCRMNVGGRA
ncbi:MAG: TldD/PmbA family protein [Spirochaetia bacterium]|nr:TldD/PmbA family protein [Spirochaetia bacterium]